MAKRKINEWFDRIDAARKIFQPWHKDYKRWVHFFRGEQWGLEEVNSTINPLVINYVYNTIKTMIPTLYFKNPKIYVNATRPEYEANAAVVQELINYDWRTLYIKTEMKRTILRSLIGGLGWLETGYVFEVEEAKPNELSLEGIEEAIAGEIEEEETNKQEFTEFKILKDSPFAIARSMLDVVIDPFSNIIEERAWHAIREIKPIEMVKRDPRFEGVKNLEANANFDNQLILNTFRDEYRKDTDLKFVELYHVTDRWDGQTFTIARGHKNRLRVFDTPDGYDIIPLYLNEDPEQPQPISVVELMQDQQQEKNRMRAYMLEHIKRSLPRMAYDRTILANEQDVQRIVNSDMDEMIGVPGNPSQILQPINFPSLPADMFNVDSKLNEDMQIASGLTDFQRGQAIKVPSATEAQFIEASSRLRVDEGLDIVSDVAAQISENIIKLRQKFTTGEQTIPIVGEGLSQSWKTYTSDEIQGEFEFVPEYGSTQKRDQDFLKSQVTQVTPIVQNLVASGNAQLYELGRQVLKVFQFPPPIINKIFPQLQDPMQAGGEPQAPQGAPQGLPPGVDIQQLLSGLGG